MSPTVRRSALAVALACAAARPLAAQEAAENRPAAPGKVLDVGGKVGDVRGRTLDVVGVTLGVEGALRDLGAKVTATEVRIELAADVLFDFDQATLRPDAVTSLRKLATAVAGTPGAVTIEGHTDSKGADDYNLKLSATRAAAVKTWLAGEGKIPAARMTTRGLGEKVPKVPNERPDGSDDPDGRQRNRRVEVVIRKAPAR